MFIERPITAGSNAVIETCEEEPASFSGVDLKSQLGHNSQHAIATNTLPSEVSQENKSPVTMMDDFGRAEQPEFHDLAYQLARQAEEEAELDLSAEPQQSTGTSSYQGTSPYPEPVAA